MGLIFFHNHWDHIEFFFYSILILPFKVNIKQTGLNSAVRAVSITACSPRWSTEWNRGSFIKIKNLFHVCHAKIQMLGDF